MKNDDKSKEWIEKVQFEGEEKEELKNGAIVLDMIGMRSFIIYCQIMVKKKM